jgi:hypothetical protein
MDRYASAGLFDPWALARDEAEVRYLTAREAQPRLTLTPKSTAEEVEAFRARVAETAEEVRAEVERWMYEDATEWERWSADLYFELYREAWWDVVGEHHAFADGQPLAAQNELRASLLQIIVHGMLARKNGAGDSTGEPSRDMTPEEIDRRCRTETPK